MHYAVEKITPQLATAYLERNVGNRSPSQSRVREYAAAMKRGEWMFNGDPVRFDKAGTLIDGQHRLMAIQSSGLIAEFLVIRDLPSETFKTIDIGSARIGSDILSIAGAKNTAVASGGIRLFLQWKNGHPCSYTPEKKVTNTQILEFYQANEIVERAARFAGHSFLKKFMGPSNSCFIYMAAADARGEKKAVEFLSQFMEPTGISPKNPVFLLRDRLLQDAANNKSKMRQSEKIALIMKAFRLWGKGTEVKQLKVATEGNFAEKDIYRMV